MLPSFFLAMFALLIYDANSEEVIIIGAGASGIAAATRLLESNITNIKLLEAENRIGGRINSVFFGDAYVDLGAEFIVVEDGNVVNELAKIIIKRSDLDVKKTPVYYSNGEQVNTELIEDIIIFFISSESSIVSVREAFLKKYNSDTLSKYKNDPKKLKLAAEFIDVLRGFVQNTEGSFSWNDSIFRSNYVECGMEDYTTWDGKGYKTILEILMKNCRNKGGQMIDGIITLNKIVTKIVWNGSNVDVQCQDGTYYSTNHVIFTPSIGVLKANYKTLFEPEYPQQKVEALSGLGYSAVLKIIFHFPMKWWNGEKNFIFLHSKEDKANLASIFKGGPSLNGTSWVSFFQNIVIAPNNPNVMIGWYTGPLTPQVEKLNKEEIKNGTMYVIRTFLGKHYNISEPIDIISSRWYNNPHFRGTYSFETVESKNMKPPPHLTIQEPLLDQNGAPRVLFAGEATHPTKYSTVHGAIESGYREADRLIKLYKKYLV